MSPGAPESVLPLALLDRSPAFERLARVAGSGGRILAGGLWGSSQAYALAALTRRAQGPWIVLASTETVKETARTKKATGKRSATATKTTSGKKAAKRPSR